MSEDFLAKVVIEGEDRSASAALKKTADTAGDTLRKMTVLHDQALRMDQARTASIQQTAAAHLAAEERRARASDDTLRKMTLLHEQALEMDRARTESARRAAAEQAAAVTSGFDSVQAGAKKSAETVSKIASLATSAGSALGGMGGAGGQAATALVGAFGAGGPVAIALAGTVATIGVVASKWKEVQDGIQRAKAQLKGAQTAGIIAGEEGERDAKAQLKAMNAKPGDESAEKAGAALEFAQKKAGEAARATEQLAKKEAELEAAKKRLNDAREEAAKDTDRRAGSHLAGVRAAEAEVRRLEGEASLLGEEARSAGEASSANMKAAAAYDVLARAEAKKAKEQAKTRGGGGGGRGRNDGSDDAEALGASLSAMDASGIDSLPGWEDSAAKREEDELKKFNTKNANAKREAKILADIEDKAAKDRERAEKELNRELERAHKETLRREAEALRATLESIQQAGMAAQNAINMIQTLKDKDSSGWAKAGAILSTAGSIAQFIPGYGQVIGTGMQVAGGIMSQFHAGGQVTAHAGTYLRGGRNGAVPVSALEGEGVVDRDTMGLLGGSRALPRIREMARGGSSGVNVSMGAVTLNLSGSAPAHRDQAVRLLREALPIALKSAFSAEEKKLAALTGTRPSR